MIVDYNYKYLIETPGTTGSYTITHKNNKGLIYFPGEDDAVGYVWPVVNFYDTNNNLIGITLDAPSGSFYDFYLFQFKQDDSANLRSGDINFPISNPSGAGNAIFLPLTYHSLVFDVQGNIIFTPKIITLY